MSMFYFADESGNRIQKELFETLFRNTVSSEKRLQIVAETDQTYTLTNLTISAYALNAVDVPAPMQAASILSYEYIQLSSDGVQFLTELSQESPELFYMRALIPDTAVGGNYICGLECEANYSYDTEEPVVPGFDGWDYYKTLPVTGSTDGDKTDYQINVTVSFVTGKMNTDFSDIRFALSDGTVLSYNRVSYTASTTANFDVKIPSLPASPTQTTIYVLYGNSSAIDASDPYNTYTYFEDWEDGKYTGRTSPRVNYTLNQGTVTFNTTTPYSGAYTLKHTGGSTQTTPGLTFSDSATSYTLKTHLTCKTQGSLSYTPYVTIWVARYVDNSNLLRLILYWNGSNRIVRLDKIESGTTTTLATYTWSASKWAVDEGHTFVIKDNGSRFIVYIDSTQVINVNYTSTVSTGTKGFGSQQDSGFEYDNITFSQYTVNPPTVGSLGTETSNIQIVNHTGTHTETINLTGAISLDNPESAPIPGPIQIVAIVNSGTYENITDFSISNRKSDGTSTFDLTLSTKDNVTFFSGQDIVFNQIEGNSETTIYEGIIQTVKRSRGVAKNTYAVTGRGRNISLVTNSFTWDAAGSNPSTFTSTQILTSILTDTGITIGSGVDLDIGAISNNEANWPGWSGTWNNKREAINSLINLISMVKGKHVNWFIDKNNQFRTFYSEDKSNEIGITITDDNPRKISIDTGENGENIVNKITGYAGSDNGITVTLQDDESIYGWVDENTGLDHPGYGIITGNFQNTNIPNQTALTQVVQMLLDRQSKPIYTATIVLSRFPDVEVGQPIYLPDDPDYSNIVFIVSDVQMKGGNANYTTTIDATTDLNTVSQASEYSAVQAISKATVLKHAPKRGVITENQNGNFVIQLQMGGSTNAKQL